MWISAVYRWRKCAMRVHLPANNAFKAKSVALRSTIWRARVGANFGCQDRRYSTWEFQREQRETISHLCRFLSVLPQRTCQPDLPPTALRWYKHCRRIAHHRLGHATVVAGGGGSDPRLRTRLGRPLLL